MSLPLFLSHPHWNQIPGLRHGFSTRVGGVSQGAYASLNLKFPTGESESAEAVAENRRRLGQALGLEASRWVACRQCHGAGIQTVDARHAGRGALAQEDGLPEADGLITSDSQVPLLIQVADCLPILLVAPQVHAIGAVHAGWRGTQAQILPKAIERLCHEFGAEPAQIQVAIGPGIGFEQFEVGPEVAEAFADQVDLKDRRLAFPKGDKYHLNLVEINRLQALNAGLPAAAIWSVNRCTFSEPELFFSFRREAGVTGRLGGLIGWVD